MAWVEYGKYLGETGRLTNWSPGGYNETISPLVLSYTASLSAGIAIFFAIYGRTNYIEKLLCLTALLTSVAPYFLGASRGSIISLFLPFALLFFRRNLASSILVGALQIAFILIVVAFFAERFDSALIERFTSIQEDVESEGQGASRMDIWHSSFQQFLDNPVFGDRLEIHGHEDTYPHNMYLEVLQTTGLIGFIPFVLLTLSGFTASINIVRNNTGYMWVTVIYTQAFAQHLFSGTIVAAAWLWASLGLVHATSVLVTSETKRQKSKFKSRKKRRRIHNKRRTRSIRKLERRKGI